MSNRAAETVQAPGRAAPRRSRWVGLAILVALGASFVGGGWAGLALAGTGLFMVGAVVVIGAIVVAGAADSRALEDARARATAGRTVEHITTARRWNGRTFSSDWGWIAVDAELLTFTPKAAEVAAQLPENLPLWIARRAIVEIVSLPMPHARGPQEILRILWADPAAPIGAPYVTTELFIVGVPKPWIALSPASSAAPAIVDPSAHVAPPRATARLVERPTPAGRSSGEPHE